MVFRKVGIDVMAVFSSGTVVSIKAVLKPNSIPPMIWLRPRRGLIIRPHVIHAYCAFEPHLSKNIDMHLDENGAVGKE